MIAEMLVRHPPTEVMAMNVGLLAMTSIFPCQVALRQVMSRILKKTVQQALDNSNDLSGQLLAAYRAVEFEAYLGNEMDLVDAVSMPVLMLVEAVENMALVDETADKINAEKRKAFILAFIGAVLFFVPIAGEVIGAVTELSGLAAIIGLLGVAGNAAFDTWTILKDPENAPLAIMGLIFAPAALADIATVARAANIRRGMADADIAKLSARLGDRLTSIKKVTGVCMKTA